MSFRDFTEAKKCSYSCRFNHMSYRLLFLLLTLICNNTRAQIFLPEALTIEEGLSQGMIYDLLQTRDGFLWIATKDGLNRYDGYNFKLYTNDPFLPYSLRENTVASLFEDSRGWLWIGLMSEGVDMFNPKTGLFYHFTLPAPNSNSTNEFDVLQIQEAADGSIWIMRRGGGLYSIKIPETWGKQLPEAPDLSAIARPEQFPIDTRGETLCTFLFKDDQHMLLATSVRQYLLSLPDKSVKVIALPEVKSRIFSFAYTKERDEHNYWCISNEALFRVKNDQVRKYPFGNKKVNDRFFTIADGHGNVWVMIEKEIWHLGPDEEIDMNDPDWVMDKNPTRIVTDRNGNHWVGTFGYGIRKFNPRKKLLHPGAAGNAIWGLWRDNAGQYYTKVGNKIFPYNSKTHQIEAEPPFPGTPSRLLDMVFAPDNSVWLIGRGEEENGIGELLHYSPDKQLLGRYTFSFVSYVYARLLRTADGKIWITDARHQLIRFDPSNSTFKYFDYGPVLSEHAGSCRVFAMVEDGNGLIWMGTQFGLIKTIRTGDDCHFSRIQLDTKNPKGLSSNAIACLLPDPSDPSNTLWIGTKSGGINIMDLRTGQCEHITMYDGLPNNVIYSILPGTKNDFWCSTNRGLAWIVPQKNGPERYRIIKFSAAKGLQGNEFNTQAYFRTNDAELLFGGVNGLNYFRPDEIIPDTVPPQVYIVGIEINHKPADFGMPLSPLKVPVTSLRQLELEFEENNVSLEFAALDFTDPSLNHYRYMLEGLDKHWVETGNKHFAHFTHLEPGRYCFRVQGNNGEGRWQEAEFPLIIIVHPPWWRTNLAYFIYAVLLIGAAIQAYRVQIKRVKLREQLAYEHREIERVKAMEQMKTDFFSNVTHEFRTPLTLMLEPLRLLLQKNNDPQTSEQLAMVERNSKRLLAMVNQLLDLAKLEHGGMQLDLRSGDIAENVYNIFSQFISLAEKKGVTMQFSGEKTPVYAIFDPDKVELVLNNLLSNALKFTPEGGKIDVGFTISVVNESASQVMITVKDTGPGIDTDQQERIFERFYQVDGAHVKAQEGAGIGLALSRELAHLMGGNIAVKSQPAAGATFRFTFPLITGTAESVPSPPARRGALHGPDVIENNDHPVVVVVDDNDDIRQLIRQALNGSWQVIEAADGHEGLQRILEAVPDLVISDLMMPLKDGYELCRDVKLNELTAHIPVILLTAKSAGEARIQGLKFGADDYLTKPFNTEELLARMNNLLESRRRLRQLFSQPSVAMQEVYEDKTFISAPDNEFLRRFTQTIDDHLSDETLGVEAFAAKMFVSRVQLHRKLKGLTGQSATDFIRNHRLDRAYIMLKNREGLVSEIAMRTGFVNDKYFSTVFREKFGISPGSMR